MLDMYFQFIWYDFIFGATASLVAALLYVVIYYFTHRQSTSKRVRRATARKHRLDLIDSWQLRMADLGAEKATEADVSTRKAAANKRTDNGSV